MGFLQGPSVFTTLLDKFFDHGPSLVLVSKMSLGPFWGGRKALDWSRKGVALWRSPRKHQCRLCPAVLLKCAVSIVVPRSCLRLLRTCLSLSLRVCLTGQRAVCSVRHAIAHGD